MFSDFLREHQYTEEREFADDPCVSLWVRESE
jgi:hypothetical protein